jgi:hypothetical protein
VQIGSQGLHGIGLGKHNYLATVTMHTAKWHSLIVNLLGCFSMLVLGALTACHYIPSNTIIDSELASVRTAVVSLLLGVSQAVCSS